jgi:bacteriophage N4 adsorption protein B
LKEVPRDERKIAIFVPCWKESDVIGNMVRHNLAAIQYRNYDFFLGVYPNDQATVEAASQLAETFQNVHVAVCPHPGPTSKADCLNWVYRRMLLLEQENEVHFDTAVLHDAEDMVHPEALRLINRERAHYAMVQVPVLPLATPAYEITHGIYCDEFAEYQTIDMPARQFSGSFIPSNGVGTAFARTILDRLACERDNKVFDPASLTEDYEIGVYIHNAGYSQLFAPLRHSPKGITATREYFPRKVRPAIRQRTRWVTGIALQCWERHGWRGTWRSRYWFWRDRKGLIANPLSLFTNALFAAGLADWFVSLAHHRPWTFAVSNPKIVALCWMTTTLQCFRSMLRMACVARIYGLPFALGVPFRTLHANFVNGCASVRALYRYVDARLHHRPLVWLKTEHAYPSREALRQQRRDLAEVLVASGYISEAKLWEVHNRITEHEELPDFLVANRIMSDDDVCKALSLQTGVRAGRVDPRHVRPRVLRSLPAHIQKRFDVIPWRVEAGRLHIAGARVPPPTLFAELATLTSLPIEFQLVTRRNYEELRRLI